MTAKAEALEANTQGRRPTGPGEYRYTGPDGHRQRRGSLCEVEAVGDDDNLCVWFIGTQSGNHVDMYPGDFVPLAKPVAAPEGDNALS